MDMLEAFIQELVKVIKVVGEIHIMLFQKSHYARFLKAHDFDKDRACCAFSEYMEWRKVRGIDKILVITLPLIPLGCRLAPI